MHYTKLSMFNLAAMMFWNENGSHKTVLEDPVCLLAVGGKQKKVVPGFEPGLFGN